MWNPELSPSLCALGTVGAVFLDCKRVMIRMWEDEQKSHKASEGVYLWSL